MVNADAPEVRATPLARNCLYVPMVWPDGKGLRHAKVYDRDGSSRNPTQFGIIDIDLIVLRCRYRVPEQQWLGHLKMIVIFWRG